MNRERTAVGKDREVSVRVTELRPTLSDWRRDMESHVWGPCLWMALGILNSGGKERPRPVSHLETHSK